MPNQATIIDPPVSLQADPVVLDDRHPLTVPPVKDDIDSRRVGMQDDVGQGLLNDAKEGGFHLRRQSLSFQPDGLELHVQFVLTTEVRHILFKGHHQSQVVEAGGT
jgi:hypothetical protein